MRVVVTGATGNVGTSLVEALAEDGRFDSIVGLARRRPRLSVPGVEWVQADVGREDLTPILRGADAVVHLAWAIQPSRDARELWRINVEGSTRVFRAAAEAEVGALVVASSVGAYSPGPKDRPVDESWPTDGIPTSFYSRHKSEVERRLDRLEAERPDMRIVRLRPALTFKREAASGIRRLFAGPFLPSPLVRRGLIGVVPDVRGLVVQAVHTADVAEAYRLALVGQARGAFNVAADPVLDPPTIAGALGARLVRVPAGVTRTAASLSWRLRLQPSPPGWVDLGLKAPVMSSERARRELGWWPRRTAVEALLDLLAGIRERAGLDTPPLAPGTGGPLRLGELASGVGARLGGRFH